MNDFENPIIKSAKLKDKEAEAKESRMNIGEIYFDKGLEDVLDKKEFASEVQKINKEIGEYLGENKNTSVYDFRVYSDRKEYENYLKTNFPEKPEEDYMDNDMYCIYDEKNNKYFIGKFMTLEMDPNDPKVLEYMEKTKITFDELKAQNRKNYKNNIYPTIAHELTHTHSFFKGVNYREPGNKWAQEMVSVFIDQKMWEKYTKDFFDYRKMIETRAREQARNKDPYDEIIKDFQEGDFQIEDWERLVYQFLEKRFGKEKLKEFWSILCERRSEADLEQCFEEVFEEKLKDVMMLFREEMRSEHKSGLNDDKTETHMGPMIERLNSGYKLIYHYSDGEKITVERTGSYSDQFIYVTHETPDGKIERHGFNRTGRKAKMFFNTDIFDRAYTFNDLKEFVRDKNLGQVLDVGTGQGEFVDELREAGVDARGLDIWLDNKQMESGNFILASAHQTGLPDNSVDTIFINTFMHYGMENEFRRKILEELARILRPGGRILMGIAKGEQKKYYDSILKDLKLEINASSEFSEDGSRGRLGYTEFRKISDQGLSSQ